MNLTDVTFRTANIGDAERMTAFVLEIAEGSFMPGFSPKGRESFREQHSVERTIERIGSYRYRLAERHGELTGLIGIRDNTHLHHLFVAPEFQGRGLGRRLWEMEKAESLKTGASVFTVNASLNAVPVYERFGFAVCAPMRDVDGVQFIPMSLAAERGV